MFIEKEESSYIILRSFSEVEPLRALQGEHTLQEAREILRLNPAPRACIALVVERRDMSPAEKVLHKMKSVVGNSVDYNKKTQEFAQSLLNFHAKNGYLSQKQIDYAEKIKTKRTYFGDNGGGSDMDGAYTMDGGWMMNTPME